MNTSDLELFLRIAETGSITATAKQFALTPAAVSYAVKRLEQQVKIQLFIRSTRQLRITPEGEKFLFHASQALQALERGQLLAQQSQHTISGELRCSLPSDLGRNLVFSWLDTLLEAHPDLSIDLNVNDSLVSFYTDQVDVALRYGKPQDSNMIAFQIATVDRVTCASPEYLKVHGAPKQPQDIMNHQCLLYRRDGRLFNHWHYEKSAETYKVKVSGTRISNDTDIVRRWAVAGKGVAYRSEIDISSDLASGKLVRLLSDFSSPPVELYLLCPSRKQVTPAVIAFREMLRDKCAELLD